MALFSLLRRARSRSALILSVSSRIESAPARMLSLRQRLMAATSLPESPASSARRSTISDSSSRPSSWSISSFISGTSTPACLPPAGGPAGADHSGRLIVQVGAERLVEGEGQVVHLHRAKAAVAAPAPDLRLAVLRYSAIVYDVGRDDGHERPGLIGLQDDLHLSLYLLGR